jgi:hypothetical protein
MSANIIYYKIVIMFIGTKDSACEIYDDPKVAISNDIEHLERN